MKLSESIVADQLRDEGYFVLARGWPDFLAFNDDAELRFVEVKATCREPMSEHQERVAQVLALKGIDVELRAAVCVCGGC